MTIEKVVTDQNGVKYELTEKLGVGGQGVVYAVKGGRLAVKIVFVSGTKRREMLRNQLMHVRRLSISDLPLAKPLEMLRPPHTGYVMELVSGMEPIKKLITPSKNEVPNSDWYLKTGGLRRRLLILGGAANILSQLHGKGLAYSDPSPNNIFVSDDDDYYKVWFIDIDNLVYESTPSSNKWIYTPGYAAPEIVNGKSGITTLSDVYAFAIIAFQVLALAHPFIGDMVNDGVPELEENAFAGLLPWIDDPSDDQNRASFGIPRDLVFSKRLLELFQSSFTSGRFAPNERPGASEWAERLYAAADATIICRECTSTYFYNQSNCPWCDSFRPVTLLFVFYLWDPDLGIEGGLIHQPKNGKKSPVIVGHGVMSNSETYTITYRQAFGNYGNDSDKSLIKIKLVKDNVVLKSLNGKTYQLEIARNKETTISDIPQHFKFTPGQDSPSLHLGSKDRRHRVLSFVYKQEAKK